jgi:hypothetical protein
MDIIISNAIIDHYSLQLQRPRLAYSATIETPTYDLPGDWYSKPNGS